MRPIISKKNISKLRIRPARGAAIVGGVALMTVISALGAGLIFILANMSALSSEHQQLQSIGQEAARQIAASKYWLGMERPEYVASDEEFKAKQSVNAELSALGLPPCRGWKVSYNRAFVRDIETSVVCVDFDVLGIKIATGSAVPEFVSLHVSAVSSDSEHASRRHGSALMLFVDEDGTQRGIRVPIYNSSNGNNESVDSDLIKAGPSVGNFPNAFFKLKSEQDTWIHDQEN